MQLIVTCYEKRVSKVGPEKDFTINYSFEFGSQGYSQVNDRLIPIHLRIDSKEDLFEVGKLYTLEVKPNE